MRVNSHDGISALKKKRSDQSFLSPPPHENTAWRWASETQEEHPHQTQSLLVHGSWISNTSDIEKYMFIADATQSMVFLIQQPELRQSHKAETKLLARCILTCGSVPYFIHFHGRGKNGNRLRVSLKGCKPVHKNPSLLCPSLQFLSRKCSCDSHSHYSALTGEAPNNSARNQSCLRWTLTLFRPATRCA